MSTLIICVIAVFAAFYSGFYFGYTKREGKPPESMPIISDVAEIFDKPIEKPEKPTREEMKTNSFFN